MVNFNRKISLEINFNGSSVEKETPLITNVDRIEISSLLLPNTSDVVKLGINDTIILNGNTLTIPNGIYTPLLLRNTLRSLIQTIDAGANVSIDTDKITYTFTFSSSSTIKFYNKTGDLLGFENNKEYISGNLESIYPYRVMETPIYYLKIDELSTSHFNKYRSNAVLNNNAENGGMLSFNRKDEIFIEEYQSGIAFNKLTFNLYDEYGNDVNLNNHRSFITLLVRGN